MTREVTEEELRAAQAVAEEARALGNSLLYARVIPYGVLHLLPWRAGGLQLSVGHSLTGTYDDTWIYDAEQGAFEAGWRAAIGWDGDGEPEGWTRHVQSGRRRPEGDPAREYEQP
jgi:hypothetical protein